MKKYFILLLASMLGTSAHAFYMAWQKINGYVYPHAVIDIAHDDQHIYVSSLDGFIVIDKATGEQTVYNAVNGNLDYTPTALAVHDGKVWIGTKNYNDNKECKLLTFDGQEISTYDNVFDSFFISNIVFDADGCMYVSGSSGQGYRIEEGMTPEKFTTYHWARDGWTAHLALAHDGTLWMANFGWNMNPYGLSRYTAEEGTVYPMKTNSDLPNDKVTALAIDDEDGIWYASTEIIYEAGGKRLLTRLKDDQVSANYDCVYRYFDMQFDAEQRLWLAGESGPLQMMKDGEFTDYPCPIDDERWMCMDIDGDVIYIGTEKSLLMFKDGEYTKIAETTSWQEGGQTTAVGSINTSGNATVCDLQGRRLSEKPERGLYIQDGRKVMIK